MFYQQQEIEKAIMVPGGKDQPEEQSVDDVEDLLAGYALDILDEEDRERVAAAVAASPELQSSLAESEDTVGRLGQAVPRHQPPPSLRRSIMSKSRPESRTAEPVPIRRFPHTFRWFAAAAAILVVGLAIGNILLLDEIFDRGRSIDEMEERLAMVDEVTASLGVGVDWEQPLIWSDMVVTDDSAYTPVSSQQPLRQGLFCRTPDGKAGWIIIVNMPLEPDQVYQAWLQSEDGTDIFSVGTFVTDDSGRGFLPVISQKELHTLHSISLTIEPHGGSPLPTSPIVLVGRIK